MRTPVVLGLAALTVGLTAAPLAAIPAWARKYNMNCDGCHYPAPPRLNATGIRFRWAGYRMPEEMNEAVSVEQVSNYIAANGQVVYSIEKTSGTPTQDAFETGEAALFYAGALGRHYMAWLEYAHAPDGSTGMAAKMGGTWGQSGSYGGFRVGQGTWLFENGIAGFDRPVSLNAPLPMDEPTTGAVPFALSGDQVGGEGFWVRGRNRLSGAVMEPMTGVGGTGDSHKDFMVADQLLLNRQGAGIQAVGYYGTVLGLDNSAATLRSNFWRAAVSANWFFSRFEVLGGLVYGQDRDLPTGGGSPFATDQMKGTGYWLSGQYYLPHSLAFYGRYEFADPNTSVADDADTRFVLGAIAPLTLPQYLRLNVEYWMDDPQVSGASSTNHLAAGLSLTF